MSPEIKNILKELLYASHELFLASGPDEKPERLYAARLRYVLANEAMEKFLTK